MDHRGGDLLQWSLLKARGTFLWQSSCVTITQGSDPGLAPGLSLPGDRTTGDKGDAKRSEEWFRLSMACTSVPKARQYP